MRAASTALRTRRRKPASPQAMTVIALASSKGGVGKTTLTMNLAAGLSRRGRTVVVDADPQQSAGQSRRGQRYVVVDCPPSFAAPQTQAALQQADLLLVPMQPSPVDLWAGTHVIEWVSLAKSANPRLSAWIVLNQVEPNTRLWKDIKEAMAEMGLPALKAMVRRRAA